MKNILKYGLVLASGLAALALSGCGGDSGGAPAGPSTSSSFAGTSISFNPDITFSVGDNLTYLNRQAGSPFPLADPAVNGKYSYTPNANFTAGTLRIYDLDDIPNDIVLEISNFVRSGANVTGFTARSGGQSYPVSVTGTLAAHQAPSGGGGGTTGLVNATADIASAVQGTHELTFFNAFGGEKVSGSPHDAGDTVAFEIGARTLKVGSKTLTNPRNPSSMTTAFVYQDGNLWYWIYPTMPVRINLYGGINPTQSGTTFYGGFDDPDSEDDGGDTGGGDTSGELPGTYSGVFTHQTFETAVPPAAPANGSTVTFSISQDLQSITFNGVTLPQTGDGRPTSLSYSNAATSPTNSITVTIRLNGDGAVSTYEGMYNQLVGTDFLALGFTNTSVTKQ